MGQPVVSTALMNCSFGLAPASLNVLPKNRLMMENKPVANIMDNIPFVNVPAFGVCNSLANPQTAALTAAALGVLTPGPCIPTLPAPWTPGSSTVLSGNFPALNTSCKLMCAYGGQISFIVGQAFTETVP